MKRLSAVASICLVALSLLGVAGAQTYPPFAPSNVSRGLGRFYAPNYAYGFGGIEPGRVQIGNASTGSQTITVQLGYVKLPDGRLIQPFATNAPILIGNGTNQEQVTPTAVSGCIEAAIISGGQGFNCNITASFNNLHGQGEIIESGTYGLQEAINDAFAAGVGQSPVGAGTVTVDEWWRTSPLAGTNAIIAAATVYGGVSIEDLGQPGIVYWNPQQTASTFLAVPTTLTATTVGFGLNGANTTGGAYNGGSTYHVCIAYVDVAGQVGACSSDFSGLTAGSGTTNQIGIAAPAASTGAVGYVVYISLAGGTYSLAYQAPLSSSTCTLTKVETVTPACAVTNTTYNQVGSNAVISALTVNTSPVDMQLGGVSGTLLTGNPNGRTTYGYVPSSHLGALGVPSSSLPFTAGGIGSATPIAIGTVNVPAGWLNYVGKEIRVCGKWTNTDVNSTVQNINIYWDAAGSDSAGAPVQIASLAATAGTGTAATYTGNFCWQGHTSVSGAGATAGSIFGDFSFFDYYLSATPGNAFPTVGGDTKTAAVGSLNLAGGGGFENRISIVHTNTTGNATPQLQNLTIEVL